MQHVKAALKLLIETVIISTVGSLFWMVIGKQAVTTYAGGGWEIASSSATFWTFFIGIVQLYLLYRLVLWLISLIAKKTAKTVDNTLQDVAAYSNVRDRVVSAFEGNTVVPPSGAPPPEAPPSGAPPAPPDEPGRCPSCGVRPGRVHLSGCQRNAR